MCTIAGGLFEVVLGFWLLIKGLEPVNAVARDGNARARVTG
jgi:hypothetical protein